MEITDVISMVGAIAVFLFGMNIMTTGLEKLSSGRLERILERLTNNVFKGVLLGALVTAIIHSSATTTVMCVGFVNAGIMRLEQTIGIIMGANIGTTVTAQILRLSSISAEGNPILTLLQPEVLGPVLAIIGIVFYMFIKGGQKKNIGEILLGMGLLFIGMSTMTTAVAPLQNEPWLKSMFAAISNPVLGMLVGAAVTAVLQSSTAFTGIILALSTTGAIQFNTAIFLIMGQNIGTTVTALLSSTGASKNAKRTALIHLFFNLFGAVLFLIILYVGNGIFHFDFWDKPVDMGGIANFHLIFNLTCTLVFLPFRNVLVRLVKKLVPRDKEEVETSILDERFLVSASLAMEKCHEAVIQMGEYCKENFQRTVNLLEHFDEKRYERLSETENILDKMEVSLNNYLVMLTDRALTVEESGRVSELLHAVSDFERIGDYIVNVAECVQKLHEQKLEFSEQAKFEVDTLNRAVKEIIDRTVECYINRSTEQAAAVEPLEEVIDLMRDELRDRHIERLKKGGCTVELGTQFLEMLINLERIADHCSNVAMYIVRENAKATDLAWVNSHAYLHELHHGASADFDKSFERYREEYYDTLQSGLRTGETQPAPAIEAGKG